jgi:hypothetical protein
MRSGIPVLQWADDDYPRNVSHAAKLLNRISDKPLR